MPGPRVRLASLDHFWIALHGRGGSLHPRPEELPAPAGLFQHRPQRHHGARARFRRAFGHPGNVAPHDIPFRDQAPHVFLRRKCAATPEDRSVPKGERRIDSLHAIKWSGFPYGDSRSHWIPSFQPVPERVHYSARWLHRRLFRPRDPLHFLSRTDFCRLPRPYRESGSRRGSRPSSGRDLQMEKDLGRWFDGGDCRDGLLDTCSLVSIDSRCSGHRGGWMMADTTSPMFEALQQQFGARREASPAGRMDEVYLLLAGPDVRPITDYLRGQFGARLVLLFAEDRRSSEGVFFNYYVFEQQGSAQYLMVKAPVRPDHLEFPSLSAELPSVNWQEREIQDWFGLKAVGHPNPRRVALHDNWPEVYPLRKDFPLETVLPPFEGERHIYRPAFGEGVLQVPVGPVHAGIIEPGHFNFAVAGEPILYLQLRMFYTHKGTEKLFEKLPIHKAVFLAESISGDSRSSHGTAFCQAIERAAQIEVPLQALVMRTILLELERVCNHVADIGAIATDVGFVVANAHASRLKETMVTLNEQLTGSRLLRGIVCVGGVRLGWNAAQLDTLRSTVDAFASEFQDLIALIDSSESTRDRLEQTGVLRPEKAKDLGIVGVAGRASGMDLDTRRDHPYAAYGRYSFRVPVYHVGDVSHRLQVRVDEVNESLGIIRSAANESLDGDFRAKVPPIPADRCALSAVEGWRGEIIHWIRTGANNHLERCKIKDPSLNNWPALVEAVQGNIIADFPVINKSFNLSYSGTDR